MKYTNMHFDENGIAKAGIWFGLEMVVVLCYKLIHTVLIFAPLTDAITIPSIYFLSPWVTR